MDNLTLVVALLAAAVVSVTLLRRLQLPDVVAYLLVGLAAGPSGFALVDDTERILHLAEFGVVFLLFSLGLEFSIPRLVALRHIVLGAGPVQVLGIGALVGGVMHLLGFSPGVALVTGGAMALSSTAIVIRELIARSEVNTRYGRAATGILLFQDLAAVIMLVLLPTLAASDGDPLIASGFMLAKAVALFVGIYAVGQWVLPRVLEETLRTRSSEVFVMTALLLALLAAWVTHALGLSMALGAFLAGMMLGESQFRHQIESDIRPFRDLLLGLFFISVGMLVDPGLAVAFWYWILLAATALLLAKGVLISLLLKALGEKPEPAVRAGMVLAQAGEFGFVLIMLAVQYRFFSTEQAGLVISIIVVTMAVSPALIRYSEPWAQWLLRRGNRQAAALQEPVSIPENANHVILCGYGRVGQVLGRYFHEFELPWIAIDADLVRVEEASAARERILFGDASHTDILEKSGIHQAKLLVITFDDTRLASKILHSVRELRPDLRVLVRTRDDTNLDTLRDAGATEVVPETLEASLMLTSQALLLMDRPFDEVLNTLRQSRREHYQLLRGYYHGENFPRMDSEGKPYRMLHAITLDDESRCAGRRLDDTGLDRLDVVVREVKREDFGISRPGPDFILQAGDTVILYGPLKALEKAEDKLLAG